MEISGYTASDAWLQVIDQVLHNGAVVDSRNGKCLELINAHTVVPMRKPIVTVPTRKIGYRFMFAEAHWILSGDNRVSTMAPYSKTIANYSDNGETFFGAYGPKVVDQLPHVVSCLGVSLDSRQAVINIWRENPGPTKDVPCTLSAQFVIRTDDKGIQRLHCIDTMRSSDAWMGWTYDVFNFTMLTGAVALLLRQVFGIDVELGNLYMNLGSLHLYEKHWGLAKECLKNEIADVKPRKFRYPFFEPLKEWPTTKEFYSHLENIAKQKPEKLISQWCHCIARGVHNK